MNIRSYFALNSNCFPVRDIDTVFVRGVRGTDIPERVYS
jgi:hypothetical protein